MTKAGALGYLMGMRKRAETWQEEVREMMRVNPEGYREPGPPLGKPSVLNSINRGLQRSLERASYGHGRSAAGNLAGSRELSSDLRAAMPYESQWDNNQRVLGLVDKYNKNYTRDIRAQANVDRALKNINSAKGRGAVSGLAGLAATLKGIGGMPAAGVLTGQAGLPVAATGAAGVLGAGTAGALAGHGVDKYIGPAVTPDRTSLSDWWGKQIGNLITPLKP